MSEDDRSVSDRLQQRNEYVGARIRVRRKQRGMTQTQLGASMGLTFQQVQKYEQGSNGLSAARLIDLARALDVHPMYFYEAMLDGMARTPLGVAEQQAPFLDGEHAQTEQEHELVEAFRAISTPDARQALLVLVKSMRR